MPKSYPSSDDFARADALPCVDKLVFDSKQQADVSANVLHYQRGLKLRSYKCRHCHLWHLSTDHGD